MLGLLPVQPCRQMVGSIWFNKEKPDIPAVMVDRAFACNSTNAPSSKFSITYISERTKFN